MKRHLTAALLTGALALGPTAAFAQDGEPAEPEPTALETYAEFLAEAAELLAAEDGDEGLRSLLAELLAAMSEGLYIESFAAEAEAVEANLEDENTDEDDDEASEGHGEAVSTVAHCAPRGSIKDIVDGMTTHGAYVTAAAHGDTVALNVPVLGEDESGDPTVTTESEATDFDLSTVEGAEGLCAALDVAYQARLLELELAWDEVDSSKDARVLVREACKIDRLRAKNGTTDEDRCAELRQRVKDLHADERAEAKADRDADKQTKAEERDARKAENAAARDARKAEKAEARGKGASDEA